MLVSYKTRSQYIMNVLMDVGFIFIPEQEHAEEVAEKFKRYGLI